MGVQRKASRLPLPPAATDTQLSPDGHRTGIGATGRMERMNLLSALAPTSVPVDPVEGIQGHIAFTAATRAVKVANEVAQETVKLLDPNLGQRLNASA